LKITDIRADDEQPGLRDFEASFLRLVEKLSNGCTVSIAASIAHAGCNLSCGAGAN
jgi:RNA 3'-terminal phosphate cyclase-like protein